ncbi:uncharacterized protein LOC113295759 [Papaver somniferum]|uniref:uncharacterized protein LOC113295759 n=1 Tax=Papaver somniferum TaxID=3469 RepID=UPI000E6F7578|nr:uncharacterized protein LOC113295759 [Papaver somniferum]
MISDMSDENLINFAMDAKDPWQFMAKVQWNTCDEYKLVPISQDASASAYQIMSFLFLNVDMAMKTNLIPNYNGLIRYFYKDLLCELKNYLSTKYLESETLMEMIFYKLDRKLIKSLFMPMVYGKTQNNMANDICLQYGKPITGKQCHEIASHCLKFFKEVYKDIYDLMRMLNFFSWITSVHDRHVLHSIPYFTTKQDYKHFKTEEIFIYDKDKKRKKRKVIIWVPSDDRDHRKTKVAACANFIHQKDAFIAMKVVEKLLIIGAPIYTVHDNFINKPPYVRLVPKIYTEVFNTLEHPVTIINDFLRLNILNTYLIEKEELPWEEDHRYMYEPIPQTLLEEILYSNKPLKESKPSWSKKVKEHVKYYTDYTAIVGYPQEHGDAKWNEFKKQLGVMESNFSIHY